MIMKKVQVEIVQSETFVIDVEVEETTTDEMVCELGNSLLHRLDKFDYCVGSDETTKILPPKKPVVVQEVRTYVVESFEAFNEMDDSEKHDLEQPAKRMAVEL